MKHRAWIQWTLSFLIVAGAAVYQRMTGPTYPERGTAAIGSQPVRYRLPTSSDAPGDHEIRIPVPDRAMGGFVRLRRALSNDEWSQTPLERQGDSLVAVIPHQPPAGKIMYHVFMDSGAGPIPLTANPVTMRFKGAVPLYILMPHVLCMFMAMWLSTLCGIQALLKKSGLRGLALWTLVLLGVGGLILGPIQQKLAFGAFWTGWPFGNDLTDNKTIVAVLFWVIAVWRLRKTPEARGWVLAASLILMSVYMIPHSMLGSEIDHTRPSTNL